MITQGCKSTKRKLSLAKTRRAFATRSTSTTFDKIELTIKILTFIAVVAGGSWALYLYRQAGSDDWQINMHVEAKVLPYHDNLRLLVIHAITKNPRNFQITLSSKEGDSYKLRIQKIPSNAKEWTVFNEDEDKTNLIATVDLLKNAKGEYAFAPNSEFDDTNTIVLPVHTIVQLTADMETNSDSSTNNEPNPDFNSASTVIRIEP